ncbi:TPA: hypothetical protein QCY71_003452 [Bacillus cereus]|nr:hypothetical protein [Bacillus cereus]
MQYLQVESEDIKKLNDIQLTKLLSLLLYNEADKEGLVANAVAVALNITVGDAGEDGHIQWQGDKEKTNWLPDRFTLFQVKATPMPSTKCKGEVIGKDKKLKQRVKDVFLAGGTYILFHNEELNQKQIDGRIGAFEAAIHTAEPTLKPKIQIYDAAKIAAWTNKYISAVCAVWGWNHKLIEGAAKTWEEWNKYSEHSGEYVSCSKLQQYIDELRGYFIEEKKVARIMGLSGIGKSRLAFEAFRGGEEVGEASQKALSKKVIYIDASNQRIPLPAVVSTWRNQGFSGILIVDNCDSELHNQLKIEVEHTESKFSLLTIDYNLSSTSHHDPEIYIDEIPKEVIQGIISNSYPEMEAGDKDRIVTFSDGFPRIATLLAEARINDLNDIGSLRDEILIKKLLWGRDNTNEVAQKVIEICSVFENIGFEKEKENEMEYVANYFCNISADEFYGHCQYFLKKGILVKRGRFIKIVPQPLAVTLAAHWWTNCRPKKALEILSSDMPRGMKDSLCKQISKLHFLEKAKELTTNLCGSQAPFGQAEVLNSKEGSRIFCSLVEVDPETTVSTLEREFANMDISNLKLMKDGRRNLVRALEKLCFWESTFERASLVLLRFAAAENEKWANNATGQFFQLFHYILSGTQAKPAARLGLIDFALGSSEDEIRKLGVEALGHVIQTQDLSRMVGVEYQGSRPVQQEWRPKNWGEIFDYWEGALERLTIIATSDDDYTDRALKIIADNIRGLVSYGQINILDSILYKIFAKVRNYWPEALESITEIIQYDKSKLPPDALEIVQQWKESLVPEDFKDSLSINISLANSDYVEKENPGDDGKYIDLTEERVKQFAEDVYLNKFNELMENLECLMVGEQRQAYIFGKEISKIAVNHEVIIDTIEKKLSALVVSRCKDINVSFVGGYLSNLQTDRDETVQEFLDRAVEREYSILIPNLTRYLEVKIFDLKRLIGLLEEGKIPTSSLMILAYGRVTDNINSEDMIWFVKEIEKYEEQHLRVCWEILFMYCWNDNAKFVLVKSWFEEVLMKSHFFANNLINSFEIEEILKKIYINSDDNKPEFTREISKNILQLLGENVNYKLNQRLKGYTYLVTKYNWCNSWELFSEALISSDGMSRYELKEIIGTSRFDSDEPTPIRNIPEQALIEWCSANEIAPEILAEIYPITSIKNGEDGLKIINTLIDYLLENYNDNERVLLNIDSQLVTFSWIGSVVPYYEKIIHVYKPYLKHNNINLRKWSQRNINRLERNIQKEKIRDEENGLRF